MIEKEFGKNPLNDSLKNPLKNEEVFHHTILRVDLDRTYGLYENSNNAELGKETWEKEFNSEGKKQMRIIELNQSQEYKPWGEGGAVFTHGKNDGTHGSERKNAWELQ